MPQKTNLNVSPYHDDFDRAKNFYKVLFKPGFPIQARELTNLQSILQDQVEQFGSHVFKEGSMVIPGGVTFDPNYTSVKVNDLHLGLNIKLYLDAIIENKIQLRGQNSDILVSVRGYLLPSSGEVDDITLFVKYISSDSSNESVALPDNEILLLESSLTYGNTTLNSGDSVITLVSADASHIGSAVHVAEGVYFIRGTFTRVSKDTLILDPYSNNVSYRIGLSVNESIITSAEDNSLNDNAKGFTNYAAPGADRFKIDTLLSKKLLTDNNDINFIELLRIVNGKILKVQDKSVYSNIKEYLAKRTFDESGNYALDNFEISVENSLNDNISRTPNGLYSADELTDNGNVPSDDLMSITVSPGTAYVKGFDVQVFNSSVDVPKPRTTNNVPSALIPFDTGSLIRVNNVYGAPVINLSDNTIDLYDERRNPSIPTIGTGNKIGSARVYWFGLTDDSYSGAASSWDLYLYDIQTYTNLETTATVSEPIGSYVRGLTSGATGYLDNINANVNLSIINTSGKFLKGESIIFNEDPATTKNITDVIVYSIEDVKSVFQDSNGIDASYPTDFGADTILYDFIPGGFSATDTITISSGEVTSSGKFFTKENGFSIGTIIKFQDPAAGSTDPLTYAKIDSVNADSTIMQIVPTTSISGVNKGTLPTSTAIVTFKLGYPEVLNYDKRALYSPLAKRDVASIDLSKASLTITRQSLGNTTNSNGELSITISDVLDSSSGLVSAFFEPYDAELYSVTYSNGTIEDLTSDQVTFTSDYKTVNISGLTASQTNVNVTVTLRKTDITSKSKIYSRSNKLTVNKSQKDTSTLTKSTQYGLRVEDNEISLNVPDVVDVVAVYESTNSTTPVLDKFKFITGYSLDVNSIPGEKIVGKTSKATAQLISATSPTEVEYVRLSPVQFIPGETVVFQESNIQAVPTEIIPGSYVNLTSNYKLDKGHKKQYCDYSKLVRTSGLASPKKELLIIFNYYKVEQTSGSTGDIFTVNSYPADRFTYDIPSIDGLRISDTLDFRPRVAPFTSTSGSPFAFSQKTFESVYGFTLTPNTACQVSYDYYLGRFDRVSINSIGDIKVSQGTPSENPQFAALPDGTMELAQIRHPAYLYNPSDSKIRLIDNQRYTMRDIGNIFERVENLEETTALSLLEVDTKSLVVKDATGLNKFKSGFIVSNFSDKTILNTNDAENNNDIDSQEGCLRSSIDFWSIAAELALDPSIDKTTADLNANLKLLDPNIKKTGDILTLDYTEVEMINQPHATGVENVNPFNVIAFVGGIKLDPPSDNWARTVYEENIKKESTGAYWRQTSNTTSRQRRWQSGKKLYTETTTTTNYGSELVTKSPEIDFVESVKITTSVDPYMRERNVYFAANGLKPFTKHYHVLDKVKVDIIPKVNQIEMTSGTFSVGEEVEIFDTAGDKVALCSLKAPNHKFGSNSNTSEVAYETYSVNIYDKGATPPGENYSSTSTLINFDVKKISLTDNEQFGYITEGCKVVGKTSSAVAQITKSELISDNFGDIIGAWYFRDPLANPKPTKLVKTGTKTFKITAVPPGTVVLPGSSKFASSSEGTFSGSGVITLQETTKVRLRNPPKPADKPTSVKVQTQAVHRDPLAQTFTTDSDGAYLTSVDAFFASKDDNAKVFVELRTVELGTPTNLLVQDYATVELNPSNINIPEDPNKPVATNIKFPSPIYLEPNTEYALVYLAPASDLYEMYVATMGQKTLDTSSLPDVENVIVAKQYIGGSLFKSQNGTIWTPSQYQDMTFKLYKAKFVSSGTVSFYNTPILPGGNNADNLINNPISTYPRKVSLEVSNTTGINTFTPGVKIGQTPANPTSITGIIEAAGKSLSGAGLSITSPGIGYSNGTHTGVNLISLDGNGSGASATISVVSNKIVSITATSFGKGYISGERLGIVTSSITGSQKGTGAIIGITNLGSVDIDTLYLTAVSDTKFDSGQTLVYYDGATRETTTATVSADSTTLSPLYEGNVFKLTQYNHAHHSQNNKIKIVDVAPSRESSTLSQDVGLNDTVISIANTTPFARFEGITTSAGYALIESEVVSYNSIGSGTITISGRGLNGTSAYTHDSGSKITPYEINGVSLMRINTEHTISNLSNQNSMDSYNIEFDRGSRPGLNFDEESPVGGNDVKVSQNRQFNSIQPLFNAITPGDTAIKCNVRTITGTSAGGSEQSFLDSGYTPSTLNDTVFFETPRMVASQVNENQYLTDLPSNKSLTLRVNMSTENENVSPALDIKNATFILGRNRINKPVSDYTKGTSFKNGTDDPHASAMVTKPIFLEKPATSLKVLVDANKTDSADFRVLYKLYNADSTEITQYYELFPGYKNLIDTDGDGYGDSVIDPVNNSGLPDAYVETGDSLTYHEYQFSVDNLPQFNGFSIKIVFSSPNEGNVVKLKNYRALALS